MYLNFSEYDLSDLPYLSFIINNHMILGNLYNYDLYADNDNICMFKICIDYYDSIQKESMVKRINNNTI